MERIAIVSDIHGNMTAWTAVLADMRHRGITRIFCLGDVVGKGPNPEACLDSVRAHCEVVVRGNWDELVAKRQEGLHFEWHADRLGQERLSYLSSLPFSCHFRLSGRSIRLVHASAVSVYHRVQPWDSIEERLGMFAPIAASIEELEQDVPDVVGYGDVHNAYLQHISGKVLFNAGSVGNPLDIPEASYCILEGTNLTMGQFGEKSSSSDAAFNIQFIRVPYRIEEEVQIALNSGAPDMDLYINEIRTGVYRGIQK
ncbi:MULTISPECIES: metallophosphoesterase [unclassified Paenibacillus]|uniref:metallophosphoesterase family protein n=1 Tax=unclassified Paenibacillus TaxID=185978 RepID=UPI000899EBDC|nr:MULTISPECIES: metallophosphoesterase family protein [unclassified Paenibacillus]OMC64845.1 metallophosphatase family protein [Paenibacillus sp. FSL H7-0326]SDX50634.1 Predicted phosphodiesterase [Paenibacillus sp. PDC88]